MKKVASAVLSLIYICGLFACSSSSQNENNQVSTWHNTNSPFALNTGDSINDNVLDSINLISGFDNGKRYFVMPGNGAIWLNNTNTWINVTPTNEIMNPNEDFINFNVDPNGNSVIALTASHDLLYFDGNKWVNTQIDNCLTDPLLISDFSVNADFSIAAILASNGEICQYHSNTGKWDKFAITMSEDDAATVELSNFASGSSFYVFNSRINSLSYFDEYNSTGEVITNSFDPSDILDTGQDIFLTNYYANTIVLFNQTKQDFYFYMNNSWHDTKLELSKYGASSIINRGYYFDDAGNPFIFAILDNMKVILYANNSWQITPINIPDNSIISSFELGLSTTAMRLFLEYEDSNVDQNQIHDVLYDYASNKVLDLNNHDDFIGMVGSPDLNYIYAIDQELNLYKLSINQHEWQDTGFNIGNYGDASGISAISITNDGIAVMTLTNGMVVSYY